MVSRERTTAETGGVDQTSALEGKVNGHDGLKLANLPSSRVWFGFLFVAFLRRTYLFCCGYHKNMPPSCWMADWGACALTIVEALFSFVELPYCWTEHGGSFALQACLAVCCLKGPHNAT